MLQQGLGRLAVAQRERQLIGFERVVSAGRVSGVCSTSDY